MRAADIKPRLRIGYVTPHPLAFTDAEYLGGRLTATFYDRRLEFYGAWYGGASRLESIREKDGTVIAAAQDAPLARDDGPNACLLPVLRNHVPRTGPLPSAPQPDLRVYGLWTRVRAGTERARLGRRRAVRHGR